MRVTRPILLAAATAGVLLSVGMFTLVVEPRLKERHARRAEARALQAKLTKLQADLRVRHRIDQMYEQIAPLIAGSGSDQQEISTFTRELGNLYSALNVKTRSVKLLPTTQEEFCKIVTRIEQEVVIPEVPVIMFGDMLGCGAQTSKIHDVAPGYHTYMANAWLEQK